MALSFSNGIRLPEKQANSVYILNLTVWTSHRNSLRIASKFWTKRYPLPKLRVKFSPKTKLFQPDIFKLEDRSSGNFENFKNCSSKFLLSNGLFRALRASSDRKWSVKFICTLNFVGSNLAGPTLELSNDETFQFSVLKLWTSKSKV